MALQAHNYVNIPNAEKEQIVVLVVEFWTSKGFTVHSNSYNCIVFRKNGYGSISKIINGFFFGERSYDQSPMELTILCQILPKEAKLDLFFKLGVGYSENNPGDFSSCSLSWCNEFVVFCNQWMDKTE